MAGQPAEHPSERPKSNRFSVSLFASVVLGAANDVLKLVTSLACFIFRFLRRPLDATTAMNDGNGHQRPTGDGFLDHAADLRLGHAGIIFQLQRGQPAVLVAAIDDETGYRADGRLAYIRTMIDCHAQQACLSALLDVLGYVPDMPTEQE